MSLEPGSLKGYSVMKGDSKVQTLPLYRQGYDAIVGIPPYLIKYFGF